MLSFLAIDELGVQSLTDVESWMDPASGLEYVVATGEAGFAVITVDDLLDPVVHYRESLPDPIDVKIYKDHLYVLTETQGDTEALRVYWMGDFVELGDGDSVEPVSMSTDFQQGHNLSISPETGFGYISGPGGGAGSCQNILEVDLSSPASPLVGRCIPIQWAQPWGTHNAQCILYDGPDTDYLDKEICFLSVPATGLVVLDVSDKSRTDGIVLGQIEYPDERFAHQGVLSGDGRYFLMGDEGSDGDYYPRMIIIDVEDLTDPAVVGYHFGPNLATDHDIVLHGNRVYWSVYTDGIRVFDFEGPDQIIDVGWFDTEPARPWEGGTGTWGLTVLSSGVIAAGAGHRGLYFLDEAANATAVEHPPTMAPSVAIYPNPASDWLSIDVVSGLTGRIDVSVLDAAGRVVLRTTASASSAGRFELDVSDLAPGSYLVAMKSSGSRTVRPVTIVR